MTIDAYGNEYVSSFDGARIDVFDDEGSFITELADPNEARALAVDSKGNLYSFERITPSEGGVVRYAPTVYKPEEGEISYGTPRVIVDQDVGNIGGLAVDPTNDHLYVSWWSTFITEYESAEEGNDLLNTITDPALLSNQRLALDGQRRRLYASSCQDSIFECVVLVFEADAPYALLKEVDGSETSVKEFVSTSGLLSLAVDEETGHFFVADMPTRNVYEFDVNYKLFSKIVLPISQTASPQIAVSNSALNKAARNYRYLFVPLFLTSGSALAFEPPLIQAPKADGLAATNIGETEAELKATIDPGVDPEAEPAEYVIEYEEIGSGEPQIATSGTIPSSASPQQVSVFVKGLDPETQYRVRAFAENGAGADEEEVVFTTYSDAPIAGGCSNEALRTGASALLPDCRAYELVTPPDTNGNPTKGAYLEGDRFGAEQSSPFGNAVSFQLLGGALPGAEGTGGFYGDPYLAVRGDAGWSTTLVGPSGEETSEPQPGSFSPDQGYNFWLAVGEGSAVLGGSPTHYIRYPDGHSELIGRGSEGTDPRAKGVLISGEATHVVFQTESAFGPPVQLEPNAPPTGTRAVYDRTRDPITGAEKTHVVSLLPGNVTPTAGQNASYLGASVDGNGIAFEIGSTLYLRVGNETTYEIGIGVEFAGVSAGGNRIFYVEGADLLAYDVAGDEAIEFTETGDAIPVNVAPDGTRAYFVSEEAIAGSGPNPNGAEPQAGDQNLYLSEEGAVSFVGTVTNRDVEGENSASGQLDGLGVWISAISRRRPAFDPSRLTPDGSVFLFQSRANLDGYDPGEFPQIYRYQVGGELDCISCPPTKALPGEGAALQSFVVKETAAPFGPSGFVPSLREDGNRAFFESTEALVSGDTDGLRDVYQWEEEGVGSCSKPGGCVYLISSGHSESDDFLFGQSQSGDDVFFTTNDILVSGDQTTLSVYDARVGGGFPARNPIICEGEACKQLLTPPPAVPAPESGARSKSGNVVSGKTCPKGKRKVKRHGKTVCVKKKKPAKHKKKRKAGTKKGAGK